MKVAIDIASVLPLYRKGWISGIGRTTKELVESLNQKENLPFELVLLSQNTHWISGKSMGTHFKCKHLPFPHKSWMNRLIGMTHLREMVTGYDLLHIPHNFEWVRKPERTVVTIHDAMYFAYPDEVFDYQYAQKVYPTLAKRCRGIITCSESSKQDIMRYMDIADDKISVCPWGYREDIFFKREAETTSHPYFLSVSCSMGRKNTMAVIKAFEKIVRQEPRHELVLVWPNIPQEASSFCNQDHLRNHIYIINAIDDEQLGKLYNEATATFFVSRYEGFGLPVLESMACGTPVITCRNSSLTEVGGDAALYVDPDDIDAISAIMEQFEQGVLSKPDYEEKCITQASKFSWQRCADLTIEAYQKCLGK